MRHLKYILLNLLLILGLAGCEQIIQIDYPPHDPQLTLNGFLTPDSSFFLHLSSSVGVLGDGDVESLEEGSISLYKDGVLFDTLTHFIDGGYVSLLNKTPEANATYRVEATAPGFPVIYAETFIPAPISISSVSVDTSQVTLTNDDIGLGKVEARFQDPGNQTNYYFMLLYSGGIGGYYFFPGVANNDPTLNAQPLNAYQFSSGILFNDQSFNGNDVSITLDVFDDEVWQKSNLYVVLGNCSEEYYRYALSYSRFLEAEFNPFAEPILFPSNVENGLGSFGGFSTHTFQVY